jgi:hypothetical protein
MNDGVSLRSVSHPRASWWRCLFFWRSHLRPSSIVSAELEEASLVSPFPTGLRSSSFTREAIAEEPSLLERLRQVGNFQVGQAPPDWLNAINGWGPPLSKMANEAAGRIERLEEVLRYVLEDEPNLTPRATSSCRDHVLSVLEEKP